VPAWSVRPRCPSLPASRLPFSSPALLLSRLRTFRCPLALDKTANLLYSVAGF
jgi:hypothetical protein